MPLSLPKGSMRCQAEFAVLPFYFDRRTNLDRSGEQGHIMGPPVVLPLKNWIGWHLCLIWVHSCILFCCASHSVFTPTDESEHYFHHHSSPTPSHPDPWKVTVAEMTGLSLGCYKWVPSQWPSYPTRLSPDRRRKGWGGGDTLMLTDILRSCDCFEGFVGSGGCGWQWKDRGHVSQGPLTTV